MSKLAIYPGSFNPVTIGHLSIISKAANLFDRLVVVVAENPDKKYAVPIEQRVNWINEITKTIENVSVTVLPSGVPLVRISDVIHEKPDVIIRGLRNGNDLAYEMDQQKYNDMLGGVDRHMETVFLTAQHFNHISSSHLREVAKLFPYEHFNLVFGWSATTACGMYPPDDLSNYNKVLFPIYEAYHGK